MKLDALLNGIVPLPLDAGQVEITSLTADSRLVAPGSLFAALVGSSADGTKFVPQAVEAGAAAVLTHTSKVLPDPGVPVLSVDDPRRALALLAARFYERQPEVTVAVTGTSGKTSVAEFTRQIFAALSRQSASLGTIGVVKPDGGVYGSLTTPDPITLHLMLARLADEGVTHLAMEASSHGLDQRRLDGVRLTAAAFTNLGHDHLDYHPTVEAYLNAKLRLFDTLLAGQAGKPGTAVINTDQAQAGAVIAACREANLPVLRVGSAPENDICHVTNQTDASGQVLDISYDGQRFAVTLNLIGEYQAANALLAAGLALACGEAPDSVFAALGVLQGVRGRLDQVCTVRGATVLVDYAHKPDALDAALSALRPFVANRLICVFGCGGDRDREKRPVMGRIASEKADVVIVTDDNPRTEDAATIREQILAAAPGAEEIADRYAAIAHAMTILEPGDVLIVAGKGHETGQIIGDQTHPFSDHDAIEAISREL